MAPKKPSPTHLRLLHLVHRRNRGSHRLRRRHQQGLRPAHSMILLLSHRQPRPRHDLFPYRQRRLLLLLFLFPLTKRCRSASIPPPPPLPTLPSPIATTVPSSLSCVLTPPPAATLRTPRTRWTELGAAAFWPTRTQLCLYAGLELLGGR